MAVGKKIEALYTELILDSKSFITGVKSSKGAMDDLKHATKTLGIGVGILGGIVGTAGASLALLTKQTINQGDKFDKLSQRIGISVEKLSAYEHVANLAGSSLEGMTIGVRRLSKNILDADRGLETSKRAFEDLSIGIKNTDGSLKDADTIMLEVADRFSRMEDGAEKTAIAMDLFGRSGADLIPMFNAGRVGMAAMLAEGQELRGWTEEEARASAELQDNFTRLFTAITGVKDGIGKEFIPTIDEAIIIINEWIKANRELIETTLNRIPEIIREYILPAISTLMQAWVDFKAGIKIIWEGINIIVLEGVKWILEFVQPTLDLLEKTTAFIPRLNKKTKGWADTGKTSIEALNAVIDEHHEKVKETADEHFEATEEITKLQARLTKTTIKNNKKIIAAVKEKDKFTIKSGRDATKKLEKQEEAKAKKIKQFYDDLYKNLDKASHQYYLMETQRIEQAVKEAEELGIAKIDIEKWKNQELEQLDQERMNRLKELEAEENRKERNRKQSYNRLILDLERRDQEYYDLRIRQIRNESDEFRKAGLDSKRIKEWENKNLKKLYEEDEEAFRRLYGNKKEYAHLIVSDIEKFTNRVFENMEQATDTAIDRFVTGYQNAASSADAAKSAGKAFLDVAAGQTAKDAMGKAVEGIVGMIGSYIGLGGAEEGAKAAKEKSFWEAAGDILLYITTAIAALKGSQIAADQWLGYGKGGWLSRHPRGGKINEGSGYRDDVYLETSGGAHHYGMGGEFIMNKTATAKLLPLLTYYNNKYRGHQEGGLLPLGPNWETASDALIRGGAGVGLDGYNKGGWKGMIGAIVSYYAAGLSSAFLGKASVGAMKWGFGGFLGDIVGGGGGSGLLPDDLYEPLIEEITGVRPRGETKKFVYEVIWGRLLKKIRPTVAEVAKDLVEPGRYAPRSDLSQVTKDAWGNLNWTDFDPLEDMSASLPQLDNGGVLTRRGIQPFSPTAIPFAGIGQEGEMFVPPGRGGGDIYNITIRTTFDSTNARTYARDYLVPELDRIRGSQGKTKLFSRR